MSHGCSPAHPSPPRWSLRQAGGVDTLTPGCGRKSSMCFPVFLAQACVTAACTRSQGKAQPQHSGCCQFYCLLFTATRRIKALFQAAEGACRRPINEAEKLPDASKHVRLGSLFKVTLPQGAKPVTQVKTFHLLLSHSLTHPRSSQRPISSYCTRLLPKTHREL